MASPVALTKANASFFLALYKKLSEEDSKANVFFSPFSISAALAMVMLGAKGNTATQISEVLRFTEPVLSSTPLQSLLQTRSKAHMQMRTQMRMQIQQRSRMPAYLSKVLKSENDKEDEQSDKDEAQTSTDDDQTSKDEAQTCEEDSQAGEKENPAEKEGVHAKFAELLKQLENDEAPYDLSLANRLYGEKSYEFVKEFLEEIKKHYLAELESVDFKSGAEAARVNINEWVEKQTKEKIKNLLAKGAVGSDTKMVLVNAIYFKGLWENKFEEDDTAEAQFRLTKNTSKKVRMMKQTKKFHLISIPEVKCQVLEMPYKGGDLSMIIILPDEIADETTGLEKLEKELTFEKFVEWMCPAVLEEGQKKQVTVKLPRFKIEETYDLKGVLTKMGMVDAFDETKGDFSGMSPVKNLFLSNVVHKAFVDVNEEGTEAAAATAAVISATSIPLPPLEFTADHPFIFFIRHKSTKTVLFAGRYCSPV